MVYFTYKKITKVHVLLIFVKSLTNRDKADTNMESWIPLRNQIYFVKWILITWFACITARIYSKLNFKLRYFENYVILDFNVLLKKMRCFGYLYLLLQYVPWVFIYLKVDIGNIKSS